MGTPINVSRNRYTYEIAKIHARAKRKLVASIDYIFQ